LPGSDLRRRDGDRLDLPGVDRLAEARPGNAVADEALERHGVEQTDQPLRNAGLGRTRSPRTEPEDTERDADDVSNPDPIHAAHLERMPDVDELPSGAGPPERRGDEAGMDGAD